MSGGICDHCGFPMRIYNKIVPRQDAEQKNVLSDDEKAD